MKRAYFLYLILLIYLLTQAVCTYDYVFEARSFFSEWKYMTGYTGQAVSVPMLEQEETQLALAKLSDLGAKHQVNVIYMPPYHEFREEREKGTTIEFAFFQHEDLLHHFPFSQKLSIEQFNLAPEAFTHQPQNTVYFKLRNRQNGLKLAPLSLYRGQFSGDDSLYLFARNQEAIRSFLYELNDGEEGSYVAVEDEFEEMTKDYRREFWPLFFSLQRASNLIYPFLLILMLIYVYTMRRTIALHRLMGAGFWDIVNTLSRVLIVPLLWSALLFLPFAYLLGNLSLWGLWVKVQIFLPLLIVFLVGQAMLILALAISFRWMQLLTGMKRKAKWNLGLGFSLLMKVAVLLAIFPSFFYHLERNASVWSRYQFSRLSMAQQADISLLEFEDETINVQHLAADGTRMEEGKLSWLKACYDLLREDYPLLVSEAYSGMFSSDVNHSQHHILSVNGNFVNQMGLKNKEGQPIRFNNEEKGVITSAEFTERARAYATAKEQSFDFFYGFDHTRMKADAKVEMGQTSPLRFEEVEEGSEVRRLQIYLSLFNNAMRSRRIYLALNNFRIQNLDQFIFLNLSEDEKRQILKALAKLPFSEHLRWTTNVEKQRTLLGGLWNELKIAMIDSFAVLLVLLFLGGFCFHLSFAIIDRRLAVYSLFGVSYWENTIPILLVQLLLSTACFYWMNRGGDLRNTLALVFVLLVDVLNYWIQLRRCRKERLRLLEVK